MILSQPSLAEGAILQDSPVKRHLKNCVRKGSAGFSDRTQNFQYM